MPCSLLDWCFVFSPCEWSDDKKIILKDGSDKNQMDDQSNNGDIQQNEMAATHGMEAAKLIGQHPKNAALIAMVAGVSMGVSPELRKAVFDQILPKK